jgi:2-methylcitrate dehydratase
VSIHVSDEINFDEVTTQLSTYATTVTASALSASVRREVGRRLIDSVACAYGGLDAEPVVALRALADERSMPGGCAVWGSAKRSTPELATFVNGTAIRVLDYSDYSSGGHPSDNIAAVIAACDWIDATVDELIAGVVVSYEVYGELSKLYLRYRGWDQGTTAVLAATCAAGRVLGLSQPQLANAIGIVATSNISLVKLRRGAISAWKGLAVPYAAQSAVLVACLAAKGITGPGDAFSGEFGFWQQVSGEFHLDGLDPVADPVSVFRTGYKHWPVEYEAQFAVWLAQQIRAEIPPAEIAELAIGTSEWTMNAIANDASKWAPATRETADHSLPYIFAVTLCRGRIDSADFAPEVLATPSYVEMMARISVHADADISASAHELCTFRATVRTTSGDVQEFEISEPRGKSMTDDELDAKWAALAGQSTLRDGSATLLAALRRLDGTQHVRELFAPLAVQL